MTPSLPLSRPSRAPCGDRSRATLALDCQYLGHASLETTLIYTHLTAISEEKTREALERLHRGLAGQP